MAISTMNPIGPSNVKIESANKNLNIVPTPNKATSNANRIRNGMKAS
jgi:hypothetical protein